MNEQKTNKSNVSFGKAHCNTCVCDIHCVGDKYKDKYGDVWVRADEFTIRRVSDGHIGGWFKGEGLILITHEDET